MIVCNLFDKHQTGMGGGGGGDKERENVFKGNRGVERASCVCVCVCVPPLHLRV